MANRTVKLFRNFCGGHTVLADQMLATRNPNIIEINDVPPELSNLDVQRAAQHSILASERQHIGFDELGSESMPGRIVI